MWLFCECVSYQKAVRHILWSLLSRRDNAMDMFWSDLSLILLLCVFSSFSKVRLANQYEAFGSLVGAESKLWKHVVYCLPHTLSLELFLTTLTPIAQPNKSFSFLLLSMYLQLLRVIANPCNGAVHVTLKPKKAYISSASTSYLLLHHLSIYQIFLQKCPTRPYRDFLKSTGFPRHVSPSPFLFFKNQLSPILWGEQKLFPQVHMPKREL